MIEYLLFFIGIAFLVKGADCLIDGSSAIAKKFNVPSIIIGLTIVAFGTSLPELIVNIFASISGKGDIALGNIIGSNLANILFILGISLIIQKITIQKNTIRFEIPYIIFSAVILSVFCSIPFFFKDAEPIITRIGGIFMLLCFVGYITYIINEIKKSNLTRNNDSSDIIIWKSVLLILIGILGLYLGGRWVVDGASSFARMIGVSEYVISATIIAIGTSLPELITSIIGIIKKESDLSLGNIIGSNIFNVFFILGISSIISPIKINSGFDIYLNLIISTLLFAFMYILYRSNENKERIYRKFQGIVFLSIYLFYILNMIFRR